MLEVSVASNNQIVFGTACNYGIIINELCKTKLNVVVL